MNRLSFEEAHICAVKADRIKPPDETCPCYRGEVCYVHDVEPRLGSNPEFYDEPEDYERRYITFSLVATNHASDLDPEHLHNLAETYARIWTNPTD